MTTLPSTETRPEPNLPPEMRDEGRSRLARRAVFTIALMLSGLLIWAAFAPIEEVAVAPGQLVPAASISEVHHLEGGIVQNVLVGEGKRIAQGQELLVLRPQLAGADLGQLEARAAHLRMKRIRLTALMKQEQPDFGKLEQQFPELAEEQKHAYDELAAEAREQRREVELTIERLGEQVTSARKEKRSLEQQLSFQKAQVAIRQESFEKGYTSRHVLLQAQSNLEETRQRLVTVEGRIAELGNRREEARAKLDGLRAQQRGKWAEARAATVGELSEVKETLKKHRDRVSRLSVTAPVSGVIQSLNYKVEGAVIKPGAFVAEIVPEDGQLLAQVELKPRDIGHVRVGNPVDISFSNYDPNIVGVMKGEVRNISPTTVEDKKGRYFYRVDIALARNTLERGGREVPLLPGMTLQAKIRTGSKSLARYMLKPVFRSVDTAFAER